MRVYIAGPYTKGDVAINVRNAMMVADRVLERGHFPLIPHLTHFWHLVSPKEYDFWLKYDASFIKYWADAMLRLSGESAGADAEVSIAEQLGKPVYYHVEDLPIP